MLQVLYENKVLELALLFNKTKSLAYKMKIFQLCLDIKVHSCSFEQPNEIICLLYSERFCFVLFFCFVFCFSFPVETSELK